MREVKIKVPNSLKDIKLSQYQKFIRVTKDVEDERLIQKRMIAVYCNLTDNIVNAMTPKSFYETLEHLNKVLDFDKDMPLKQIIRINNEDYGFIPNMDKMSIGELIDLDNFIVDWETMDKAMAVLYRPTESMHRGKYTIEKYEATGKGLDVDLETALSAYFFLTNLFKDLLKYIPSYILNLVNQDPRLKSLVENGGGINQFTDSLKGTCYGLSQSLN